MKLYKDLFTNEELITDTFAQLPPFGDEAFVDVAFEVKTRRIKKGGEDFGISNNDEEGGDLADATETVIDAIETAQLQETSFTKKDFQTYIKAYCARIKKHLEEKKPDRVQKYMEGVQKFLPKLLGRFDDLQFFFGPGMDMEALCVYAYYEGEEETPRLVFLKDGLIEEKI